MDKKLERAWDVLKKEIPHTQFIALANLRLKMSRLRWKYEKVEQQNGCVIIVAFDASGHRHWIQVSPDGDCVPLPTSMRCK